MRMDTVHQNGRIFAKNILSYADRLSTPDICSEVFYFLKTR